MTKRPSKLILALIAFFAAVAGAAHSELNEQEPDFQYFRDKKSGKVTAIFTRKSREANKIQLARAVKNRDKEQHKRQSVSIADTFLISHKEALELPDIRGRLFPQDVIIDNLGMTHVRYQEFIGGYPVKGAEFIVHLGADGEVISANGRLLGNINQVFQKKITAKKAVNIAKKLVQSSAAFRVLRKEAKKRSRKQCKRRRGDSLMYNICLHKRLKRHAMINQLFSDAPPKLYIYNKDFIRNNNVGTSNPVYEVRLSNYDKLYKEIFLIDAQSAEIIDRRFDAVHSHREIHDCSNPYNNNICLLDIFRAANNHTFGRSEGMPIRGPNPLIYPQSGYLDVDLGYYLVGHLENYYAANFNRDGGNGRGGLGSNAADWHKTKIYTHVGKLSYMANQCANGGNAGYNGDHIWFCSGSVTRDVLAHEYAHAMAYYKSFNQDETFESMTYFGESGALNESNSDIMGEAFEKHIGLNDWIFAGDSNFLTENQRNLADPPSSTYFDPDKGERVPYPERYNDPNFYCGEDNLGGVHHNSTVPSKAAYLASEGGEFNGCVIEGIGLEKVEKIWQRAMTHYYSLTETFNGAFYAIYQACEDFALDPDAFADHEPSFMITADDCENVIRAMEAVEMNLPGACDDVEPYERIPSCREESDDDGSAAADADFNEDGVVDLEDLHIIKLNWHQSGEDIAGDANGDGIVNIDDYEIWLNEYEGENPPPAPTIPGDYNGDGFVDGADFTLWQVSFGKTGPALVADGNNDRIVDAADYVIWMNNFGNVMQ